MDAAGPQAVPASLADIVALIGPVEDDLPADLSARQKHWLWLWDHARNRLDQVRQQR